MTVGFMDKRSNLYYKLIVGLVIIILLIPMGLNYLNRLKTIDDYEQTTGWIIDYDEFGIGPNTYLTYEYIVDNNKYSRRINGPNRRFTQCKDNVYLCRNKRFIVVYSKKNLSNSLIDLTREFTKGEKPSMPSSLKNFQ